MKISTLLAGALLILGLQAHSQIIVNPVSSTATQSPAFGTVDSNAFKGTGLLTYPSLSSDHEPTLPFNSVVYNGTTVTITFQLGGTYMIDGVSFWNQNNGGPSTDIGFDSVRYSYSTGTTFTTIPGAPNNYLEVLTDTSPPEIDSFAAVMASAIRLEVLRNHGNAGNAGFAEIAFSASRIVSLDENYNRKVSIYPNPTKDFIRLEGIRQNREFMIFDIKGELMQRGRVNQEEQINVQTLPNGIYFLQLDDRRHYKFVKN